jgi:hypothetical protein
MSGKVETQNWSKPREGKESPSLGNETQDQEDAL